MADVIRWEKKQLMTKRLILGKAVEFADTYFKMLDDVSEICRDGGMDETYGRQFFLDQMNENYTNMDADNEEDSE